MAIAASTTPTWGTIQDAADIKGISPQTVRRYITQGLIDAERVGPRLIRVNLSSLDTLGRSLQYAGGDAR